jgi:hypothetical protein
MLLKLKFGRQAERESAALDLGKSGDTRAIKPLIVALQDNERRVRNYSARSLRNLGWAPQTNEERIRYSIASESWKETISFGDIAIDSLASLLKDKDYLVRKDAINVLRDIGGARSIDLIVDMLKDDDEFVCFEAIFVLQNLAKKSSNARERDVITQALIASLNYPKCQKNAAFWLASGLGRVEAFSTLHKLIGDPATSESAISAIESLLTNNAAGFSNEDLRLITTFDNILMTKRANPSLEDLEYGWRGKSVWTEAVDCSKIKKLAKLELSRRGLYSH